MKKFIFVTALFVMFFAVISSCTKKSNPAVSATPNATQTAAVVQAAISGMSYTGFAAAPGGTFYQNAGSEGMTHTVSAFHIAEYETTYELWYTVYNWAISNGYTFANAGREGDSGTDGAATTTAKYEPVTMISWRDTMVWCNAFNEVMGFAPMYCSDAGLTTAIKDSTGPKTVNTTPGSYDLPYADWSNSGCRMLTEGEWEFAARYKDGSSWSPYTYASGATDYYGDDSATGIVAWYAYNSGLIAHDVGGKTQNALGIYDMSGNVWEWCWDLYDSYPAGPETDYRGAATSSFRMMRGGNFNDDSGLMLTGYRGNNDWPYNAGNGIGFRLARN